MNYWIGIDGGGSHLRVAVTDDDLTIIAQAEAETANPNVIGREAAAERIQATVKAALEQAGISASDLAGIGAGIAGASAAHSEGWLREVISKAAPNVPLRPSSDIEIALVGAHGKREGVLVLAGTGSVAYGIHQSGKSHQVGGWGYVIGDEGSGYWMGAKALHIMTRMADGRMEPSPAFTGALLNALQLTTEKEVVSWLYHSGQPRNREIAGLVPLILELASEGDTTAQRIVDEAAGELALMGQTVIQQLEMDNTAFAFAGGLLQAPNPLSERLCELLGLAEMPKTIYPPVIGATLLAQLALRSA